MPPTRSRAAGVRRHSGCDGLPVAGCLEFEQFGVAAAAQHQFLVGALLDQAAVLQHENPVGHPHGAEAVRDVERHAAAGQGSEPCEQVVLGPGVEGGGRLVQHQDLRVARVAHEGAGEGDLLPFAARELVAALEPLAERRRESVRQLVDERGGTRLVGGASQRGVVGEVGDVPDADVLADRQLVGGVVLEHHRELAAQFRRVVLPDVDAVDQDLAFVRVVESAEELDDGRLARAVAADEGDRLARADREADIRERGDAGAGVPFDEGLAALLNGLSQKGLLSSTCVFVTGEFGRTPKINTTRNGRDHYARAMFMLLAGGGIKPGQVLGASDDKAQGPVGDGFKPDHVAASFFHALGIDSHKEYQTNIGRPVMIVRDGEVIPELFA